MRIRGAHADTPETAPRFRGSVRVGFSATSLDPSSDPTGASAVRTGHDFTAVLVFETTSLDHPGVVVDADLREEIVRHVETRMHRRDLHIFLGRPATCEAIAAHLAYWWTRSARPAGPDHRLVSVSVTTGAGDHGEIHLPLVAVRR